MIPLWWLITAISCCRVFDPCEITKKKCLKIRHLPFCVYFTSSRKANRNNENITEFRDFALGEDTATRNIGKDENYIFDVSCPRVDVFCVHALCLSCCRVFAQGEIALFRLSCLAKTRRQDRKKGVDMNYFYPRTRNFVPSPVKISSKASAMFLLFRFRLSNKCVFIKYSCLHNRHYNCIHYEQSEIRS